MKYKIVSTDFDDTLLRDDNTISPYTKQTIEKYIAAGGTFIINTGRMIASIAKRVRELGLKGKVIGYQGAMVYDLDAEQTIYYKPINYSIAAKLLKKLEKLNLLINIYINDTLYYKESTDYSQNYEKMVDVKGVATKIDLSEYILGNKINVTKILVYTEPELVLKLISETDKEFEGLIYSCYSKPYFYEALAYGVNKGTACKFVADSLNVSMKDVITLGDSLNDVPMLEMAGLSFAVANGQPEAKAAADFVCESNNDDGVAKIIEKYCLSEKI